MAAKKRSMSRAAVAKRAAHKAKVHASPAWAAKKAKVKAAHAAKVKRAPTARNGKPPPGQPDSVGSGAVASRPPKKGGGATGSRGPGSAIGRTGPGVAGGAIGRTGPGKQGAIGRTGPSRGTGAAVKYKKPRVKKIKV